MRGVRIKGTISRLLMIGTCFVGMTVMGKEITRPILLAGESPYKAIYLDEAVYHEAQKGLDDVRIIEDASGEEVPYYLQNSVRLHNQVDETYPMIVVNEFIKDDRSYIEFKKEYIDQQVDQLTTYLTFDISGDNFAVHVSLEGSFDGLNWELINSGKEQEIFRVAAGEQIGFYLEVPVKYTYFRLSTESQTTLLYKGATAHYIEESEEEARYKKQKELLYERHEEKETKRTILTIDNSDHLRLSEMSLETDGRFKRKYHVKGKADQEVGVTLGEGVIYKSDLDGNLSGETTILLNNAASYDEIEVIIYNYDDQPLEIKSVEGIYEIDKLVFEAKKGCTYSLSYGDEEKSAPYYDIIAYQDVLEKEVQSVVSLGKVQIQKEETKTSVKRNLTWFYQMIIGLVSILLVVMIIKSGKK